MKKKLVPDKNCIIKELPFYSFRNKTGFSQSWFGRPFMRLGACAIVTVCDIGICLKRYKGIKKAYPFNAKKLLEREYIEYTEKLFPYLHPRRGGVNTLDMYIDNLKKYYRKIGFDDLEMVPVDGRLPADTAWDSIKESIDAGVGVACLTLRHNAPLMEDYIWHWYVINGYAMEPAAERPEAVQSENAEEGAEAQSENAKADSNSESGASSCDSDGTGDRRAELLTEKVNGRKRYVQLITYGEAEWMPFEVLWDTGCEPKGGLVIYRIKDSVQPS